MLVPILNFLCHTICHVTLLTPKKCGLFLHPLILGLPYDLLWAQNKVNVMACWFSACISKSPVSSCLFLTSTITFRMRDTCRAESSCPSCSPEVSLDQPIASLPAGQWDSHRRLPAIHSGSRTSIPWVGHAYSMPLMRLCG